jgi:hypothetical protein
MLRVPTLALRAHTHKHIHKDTHKHVSTGTWSHCMPPSVSTTCLHLTHVCALFLFLTCARALSLSHVRPLSLSCSHALSQGKAQKLIWSGDAQVSAEEKGMDGESGVDVSELGHYFCNQVRVSSEAPASTSVGTLTLLVCLCSVYVWQQLQEALP